jgi:hypothetical protein
MASRLVNVRLDEERGFRPRVVARNRGNHRELIDGIDGKRVQPARPVGTVGSLPERAPIDEAVFADPIYLDCSRYAAQIHRYHLVFPRDQLLPVTSEGLRNERAATMRMVFTFIGVDPVVAPEALSREYYASATRGRPLSRPLRSSGCTVSSASSIIRGGPDRTRPPSPKSPS